ncbi:MAG: ABC transporter permease, partial [Oscillibacter sp.]|nr:ABC transporter permease [Oscillibacter sp.]
MNVANHSCIRRLGIRALGAARTRNLVAVLAIALTTILFTSLFTITASINTSYQQENFRQAGGDFHGSIKELTWEQVEAMRTDPLIQEDFARMFVGMPADPPFNKSHVEVSYLEPAAAPHYFCQPVEGTLPREGTDEAATDTRVLALLGVEPKVGAKF